MFHRVFFRLSYLILSLFGLDEVYIEAWHNAFIYLGSMYVL